MTAALVIIIIIILFLALTLLWARLHNVRKRIQDLENRLSSPQQPTSEIEKTQPADLASCTDEEWISTAKHILDKHIGDIDFNVMVFAHHMGMGKTSFGKKIKELTGLTPNNFIIAYKLDKAIEIMRKNPQTNINEISYILNFSSPSYFIKLFKEHFGQTPSAFRQIDKS